MLMENAKQIIDSLGGPTQVARLLKLAGPGAVQRVSNWARRGKIPAQVMLDHQKIFARARIGAKEASHA